MEKSQSSEQEKITQEKAVTNNFDNDAKKKCLDTLVT